MTTTTAAPLLTAQQFALMRAGLNVSAQRVADVLGVSRRSVTRWESGADPVPADAAKLLHHWMSQTHRLEDLAYASLEAADAAGEPARMIAYRSDGSYHANAPAWSGGISNSWHRALVGRVLMRALRAGIEVKVGYL